VQFSGGELIFGEADISSDGMLGEAHYVGIEPFLIVGPDDELTVPETLYAHVRLVTLTFNSNAPNASNIERRVLRPARSTMGTMPPQPSRPGYRFVAWSDTVDPLQGGSFNASSRVPDQNTTFWAVWAPETDPSAGITVNVRDPAGFPLQGALVQFVECISNGRGIRSYGYITDVNGRAFFPSAPRGNYGINVTHRDFISIYDTSLRINNRQGPNQIQSVSVTMREHAFSFRRFNWGPVLEDMRTPSNPRYRISSTYGWRSWDITQEDPLEWHGAIDINEPVDNRGEGRTLLSPFDGRVESIGSGGAGGNRITLEYWDPTSRTFFYVRYLHMRNVPLVRSGEVNLGQSVGFLGNTGRSSAAHLHLDVHRGSVANTERSNSIDPRAFFPENFVTPWNGITMQ